MLDHCAGIIHGDEVCLLGGLLLDGNTGIVLLFQRIFVVLRQLMPVLLDYLNRGRDQPL